MPPLVSILIPAHNCEKWIAETVRSALSQTWPTKEIIIVDDGSTDATLSIAKQFESASVQVISQENRGASAARNMAYRHAQGSFIQWLDADDLLDRHKISQQMRAVDSGAPDLLYSSAFGKFYWRRHKAKFSPNELWQDLSAVDWLVNKFSRGVWFPPAVWLISRKVAEKAGPWDERLSLHDDGEYCCRVVAAVKAVVFVHSAAVYYRLSGLNQLNRSTSEKACRSSFLSLKFSIEHLRALEESERTRTASLDLLRDQWPFHSLAKYGQREEMKKLARELNGELGAPLFSWKEKLAYRLLGQPLGKIVVTRLRDSKLSMAIRWDRLLLALSERGAPDPRERRI